MLKAPLKRYLLRILGLDYGEKRIGVSVCDELGLTAQGLPTLIRKTRKHDLEILGNLVKNYQVEKIVIGYPVRLDGSEGIQCEKVNRFKVLLEKNFRSSRCQVAGNPFHQGSRRNTDKFRCPLAKEKKNGG